MASSRGKVKDRANKKRVTERIPRSGIHSRIKSTRCKRANTPHHRQPYDSVSIPQLIYKLLTIDKYNQEAKRFPSPECLGSPRRRAQKYHEWQRFPYEAVDHRNSSEAIQVPEYAMESKPTSIESLTEDVMDAANSSVPTSSANSSVSNISMEPVTLANSLNNARALFRKKSLVQLINSYIKAGIEEGKRQAKKYIRKALSFGVRSGYLIPTDRQGNMLRVCPTLDVRSWNSRRTDAESRQRRRIARRGETGSITIDDRKAMRRGIPRGKPRSNVDNGQITSRRRYRIHPAQSPARSLSTRESSPRKSSDKSALRGRNKPKTVAKRKSKIIDDSINYKRRQQRKRRDVKRSVKRHRTTLSPKYVENDHDPVEGTCKENMNGKDRNQYKSIEDNYKTIVERRRSTSSREDGSKMEKQKTGTNVNDDRERIERRNADDDDDEKSEEMSIEHDTSGTIRNMDA